MGINSGEAQTEGLGCRDLGEGAWPLSGPNYPAGVHLANVPTSLTSAKEHGLESGNLGSKHCLVAMFSHL